MSLEPVVFSRVARVCAAPELSHQVEVIDTTGVEIIELHEAKPARPRVIATRLERDAPVPFASTLRHL